MTFFAIEKTRSNKFEMYFLVSTKKSREKIIVPKKWIQGLDFTKLLNNGVAFFKKDDYKVFFSLNTMEGEPDFQSVILENVDQLRPACYMTTLFKCFGSYKFKFESNDSEIIISKRL